MHSVSGVVLGSILGGIVGAAIAYGINSNSDKDHRTDIMHYVLDFQKHQLVKIDDEELENLLTGFPSIKNAFVETPDYKRLSVVNHFFKEYLNALHSDIEYSFAPYTEPQD